MEAEHRATSKMTHFSTRAKINQNARSPQNHFPLPYFTKGEFSFKLLLLLLLLVVVVVVVVQQ